MKTYQVLVAKEWIGVENGALSITDPATGEIVSTVPAVNAEAVDHAVLAGRKALEESDWAFNGALRAGVMLEWADRLSQNIEPIAERLTLENGKLLGEARFEIWSQVNVIRYNAGLARTVSGRAHSLGREVFGVVAREPMGVVAVISPWNWPITLMIRDMAPALAAGNAVLAKPASQTAGVSVEVLKLLAECENLPAGILSMITGAGSDVGQALVEHPDIAMIAFTGDVSTGRRIMRDAAPSLKKLSLELGGKSPMVICGDANLDKAVPELVSAVFTTTTGQICTAPSRLFVEECLEKEVCDRLCRAIAGIRVGNGLEAASQMGPLTTRDQYEKVLSYIEEGKKEAKLVAGGNSLSTGALARGNFVEPTLFAEAAPDSRLAQDEIFGPVLIMEPFHGDDDAIAKANHTRFGLASSVFTENIHRAWKISRALKAGTVWVNTYNRFYPETEVGGYKSSGIGRMAGIEGLHEFTQTKHINFDSIPPSAGAGKTSG